MKKKLFFAITFFLFALYSAKSQQILNPRVEQKDNKVHVYYNLGLFENGITSFVELYYSIDNGSNWLGPLKQVSGDVGGNHTFGNDKLIIWDVLKEKKELTGNTIFKVVAEAETPAESNNSQQANSISKGNDGTATKDIDLLNQSIRANIKKHNRRKNGWMTFFYLSAGAGGYCYYESNRLYEEFQNGNLEMDEVKSKVEMYDNLGPALLGYSGCCLLGAIIQGSKKRKYKKQLSIKTSALPINKGAALAFRINF